MATPASFVTCWTTMRRCFGSTSSSDPDDPSDHLNVLYMANMRTGLWEKVFSLAPLDDLERLLRQVAADGGP
jgi:hypothetical protein